MVSPNLLPVGYATATGEAIAGLITARYQLDGPITCHLLTRGFNDTYLVRTGAGPRLVLRVSGHRDRRRDDIAAETEFLAYLDAVDIPVAAPLPTRDNRLFTFSPMPDGDRIAVLFNYVEGRIPGLDAVDDARVQGRALAHIHEAADGFTGRTRGSWQLDLDHLLHRQVAAILALDLDASQARRDLSSLAARLTDLVERIDQKLTRTRCHGDCHGLNARIATSGRFSGRAVLFDFDDGGYGYLAYDLAVHLWAQVSFGRRRHSMWHAFYQGYRSVRPVSAADEAALPIFVAIRHIWLMGQYASKVHEWGSENLPGVWLENQMAFLLAWEDEKLSPTLL